MKLHIKAAGLAAGLACLPTFSAAKVTFTGYGDLRYNAGTKLDLGGPAATLAKFTTTPQNSTSRGFSANAIGLFATTEIREDLQFLMDLSFHGVGSQVGQLNLQYAYLHWFPVKDTNFNAGRVTLPFGYFNENRFYAFQRHGITAPVFQSSILGLPIADWGVTAQQRFPLEPFTVEATAYVINGYGAAQGQKTALRSAAVPGAISLTTNLRATDNNNKPALGGRVALNNIGGLPVETGVSYYWGTWDSSGLEPMYMVDAHLHTYYAGFDFLLETLHIGVRGDTGFAQSIGSPNWSTDGGFATLSYDALTVKGKTVVPYFQFENYLSRPNSGDSPREKLRTLTAGAAVKIVPQVTLKGEFLRFSYVLPDVASGGALSLVANQVQMAVVVTF